MEEQTYADWSLEVHRRISTGRLPINGTIEVTQRCNHRCLHCYNNLPVGDKKALAAELTFDEHCRIIDEIVAAGCLWLLFTGGEIFIRPDFLDIYTYAKQKGLLITLFTNGTLVTSDLAAYLARFPPFSIEITLYGHTQETYESITGIPNSFHDCIKGIHMLKERKLPLKLKTMAMITNKHEIAAMQRFVEEELGLDFKFDAMLNPRRDCSQSPLKVRLTPVEVVALDLKDPRRVAEWKRFAEYFNTPIEHTEKEKDLYLCGAGYTTFGIDPYGSLTGCGLSTLNAYDLRRGCFKEGWESYLFGVRQKKTVRQTKCSVCRIKSMCGMCPANGELECRDAEAPVDFLCRVAHLRAYAMDLPIAPHGACEYCQGGSEYQAMIEAAEGLKNTANPK